MLTNGNITLRITWNDDTAAVAAAAAPGIVYTNIMYKANIIYLNERIISQITQTPLTLYGESYANLQYTIPANETQINRLLTAPYSSLKTIYMIFRNTAAITTQARYGNARSTAGIQSYYFQYGSKMIPPIPCQLHWH
jgi:hypothetical protein